MIERGERDLYNMLSICCPCYTCGCMYCISFAKSICSFIFFLHFFGCARVDETGLFLAGVWRMKMSREVVGHRREEPTSWAS